jgi:hypothetical protein
MDHGKTAERYCISKSQHSVMAMLHNEVEMFAQVFLPRRWLPAAI